MKELMKKAHQMTKEIKAEYPEVDYKFQLGLCISYLSKNEVKEDGKMVELKGSEKQVAWANQIREKTLEIAERNHLENVIKLINSKDEANFFIDDFKSMTSKYTDDYKKYTQLQELEIRLTNK